MWVDKGRVREDAVGREGGFGREVELPEQLLTPVLPVTPKEVGLLLWQQGQVWTHHRCSR